MARRWSLPNYFPSNTQSILRRCFFLAAGNKKFQRPNGTAIAYDANEYPPDDWLKTRWARDSQTRTRLGNSLICITRSLEDNRELKYQRFWATHVNRKWAFFSFNMLWHHQICLAKSLYYYRDGLPKVCSKSQLKSAKSLLPVDMRRSKTSLLKLANAFSVLHYVINVALHSHLGY